MSLKAFNLEYLVGHHNILFPLCFIVVLYGEVHHTGNQMGARPKSNHVHIDDDAFILLFHHQKQHPA